jgi:hypothetical protein
MAFYLGNAPGLTQLSAAIRPLDPTLVRQLAVKQTIGGGQVLTRTPGHGRRTYKLSWQWLLPEEYSVLEEFFIGARGAGPYALLDPGRRNHLTANVSSTGAVFSDTTGFSADASETLQVVTDTVYSPSVSSICWGLPATVTSGQLWLSGPAGLPGIPAPPDQPWTFSVWLAGSGGDPTSTVYPAIRWYDSTGLVVATSVGSAVTVVPGSWQQAVVTVPLPPAPNLCLKAGLIVDGSTVSGSPPGPGDIPVRSSPFASPVRRATPVGPLPAAINRQSVAGSYAAGVLLGRPMLDMWGSVRTWTVGTGVPRVSILDMPTQLRILPWRDCSATLVEIG